jgi:hypothetical protein
MRERRGTFVDRVLDGHARIDQLEGEVSTWLAGARAKPLHEVLGLDAAELDLVAATPDALRYVLHARRFGRAVAGEDLAGQSRVRAHATRLASTVVDPFDLAEIETWATQVDDVARSAAGERASRDREREPSHA